MVVIPGDVALKDAPARALAAPATLAPKAPMSCRRPPTSTRSPTSRRAGKVTLFCGRGCAGARDQVIRLAETLKAPVVHALGGKEHVEHDNPYDVA